jgi:hypothetical protein
MGVGNGAVGNAGPPQENKEADPNALREPARRGRKPGSTNKAKSGPEASSATKPSGRQKKNEAGQQAENYGGNFSNATQGSFQDPARRDNQDADASRGEFGTFGRNGATHGGYGNQYREFDYERRNSPEDRYYGGPGRYGPQHNAYREYDGRNERYDPRTEYHFEPGRRHDPRDEHHGPYDRPRFSSGYGDDYYRDRQYQTGNYNDGRGNSYDNRNQPDRGDAYSGRQNDNGSRQGRGQGYADDYGHTSMNNPYGRPRYDEGYNQRGSYGQGDYGQGGGYSQGNSRRNQDEDYRSSRGGYDNQGSAGGRGGRHDDDHGYGQQRGGVGGTGQRNDITEGYGYGHSRNEQPRRPDYRTGDDRNGYGRSYGGNSNQGYGSQGGSYNDAYDDSRRDSRAGSPARGDYTSQDAARNYGPGARDERRRGHDDQNDYGPAPRRNAGRDGEKDE